MLQATDSLQAQAKSTLKPKPYAISGARFVANRGMATICRSPEIRPALVMYLLLLSLWLQYY